MSSTKTLVNVKALERAIDIIGGKERGRITAFVNQISVNRHMYSDWVSGKHGMSYWTAHAIQTATKGKVTIAQLFAPNKK